MLGQHMGAAETDHRSEKLPVEKPIELPIAKAEAFGLLFRQYYRMILSFFERRRSLTPQECEELTQETFLRAYRGMETFRHDGDVKYWVLAIAINVYHSSIERVMAAKRSGQEIPLDQSRIHSSLVADPLNRLLDEERLLILRQAMAELPEQMRRCVTLRIGHDLKYREIAEIMGISIQTVKAHLSQARDKLRGIVLARCWRRRPKKRGSS